MVIKLYIDHRPRFTCGLQSGPSRKHLPNPAHTNKLQWHYTQCPSCTFKIQVKINAWLTWLVQVSWSYNEMYGPEVYQCFTWNSDLSHQCIVSALRWLVPRSMQTLKDLVANNHKWLSTEWNSSQQRWGLAACLFPDNTFSLHSTMYICNLTTLHVICLLWCLFLDLL